MRWELSEEQQSLQESVRGWLDSTAEAAAVRQWHEAGDTHTFTGRLAADGWLDLGLDEADGGQGGGLVELALLAQEFGAHAVPSGPWLAQTLARAALGTEPGTADLVGPAGSTGHGTVLAIDTGTIPQGTTSVTVSSGGTLSGGISRVLSARSADTLVVLASDGETPGAWAVSPQSSGVTVTPHMLVDRSRDIADVRLDGVPAVPLEIDVRTALRRAASTAAVLVAADSVGAMQEMLNRTVNYTAERHQFGVPVGSFQAVKHAAATMLVSLEAARSIAYFAAASVQDGGSQADHHAAVAKAQATGEGASLADSALTLHGAIGYTWEHDLQFFYKRAKLNAFLFGSTTDWNDDLARRLGLAG